MKNLIAVLGLFVFLVVLALFAFSPEGEAQTDVLGDLLSLPAPPPPNPLFNNAGGRSYPPEFYDRKNPPPDNAPIEDLLAYWEAQNSNDPKRTYAIKPSDKVLERILREIERAPEKLGSFLNVLSTRPDAANDEVRKIYEQAKASGKLQDYQLSSVENWLTLNSGYKIESLYELASNARDTENDYVTNQEYVLALARVDWERARPVLERMLNDPTQPVSQTLARWAFYAKAMREGDSIEADRWREQLMRTVEDRNLKAPNRDLAMDALVETGDFPGRDDWYFRMLEDETLHDLGGYTGLTTMINHSPPEKYTDKMIELVKSGNPKVRAAAVRNLTIVLNQKNPDAIRALLPWLENPAWVKDLESSRQVLIRALAEVEVPESVPGLIALLDEKRIVEADAGVFSNSNVSNTNSVDYDEPQETYPYRYSAVAALVKQKNMQAVPALRRILPDVEDWMRPTVVLAILNSGGYSIGEQVAALETVAEGVTTQEEEEESHSKGADVIANAANRMAYAANTGARAVNGGAYVLSPSVTIDNKAYNSPLNPNDIKAILGQQVAAIEEPSRELVTATVDRINVIERTNPSLAMAMRKIVQNWNGAAVNAMLLDGVGRGRADADTLVKLLSLREELREEQPDDVYAARNAGNSAAYAVTACIFENDSEYDQILAGANDDAKTALLACARLIRAKLPVAKVAENLRSPNKRLAKAAELYLESEDSAEARRFIYGLYPDKAKILGATMFFAPDNMRNFNPEFLTALFTSVNENYPFYPYMLTYGVAEEGQLRATEKRLQEEILSEPEILGIYAYNGNVVKIYQDKAVFSFAENEARYRERVLNRQEFDYLKGYLASGNVGELPPFLGSCEGCQSRQLLMLGAQGGRRVYVRSDILPEFFAGLEKIFEDFQKSPGKLKYHLEKSIAGLEILYAEDNPAAVTVWKNGADLRVLAADKDLMEQIEEELRLADEQAYANAGEDADYDKLGEESRQRRMRRAYDYLAWRGVTDGRLKDYLGQPPNFDAIPRKDNMPVAADTEGWKNRAGNIEIRNGDDGIYKISGGRAVKILSGSYVFTVLTADGRWAAATKYDEENYESSLVRINMQTGRETLVKHGEADIPLRPVVAVPSAGKVLVFAGEYYDHDHEYEPDLNSYFLLDPATGAITPAKGEIRPLIQQRFRPLQPTGRTDEFWAAIPDNEKQETEVGVYNAKTFTFTPKLKIPRIAFDSMEFWVDEPENKIYFVHSGQVLALPLVKKAG